MYSLSNPIQNYAWGSHEAISSLLGRPRASKPEAELWIGAHPRAPSGLSDGRNLLEAIGRDPSLALGDEVWERFGRLPFLLKVLAVESPLSLQAHPNRERARVGFAREEAARIPISAPERTYKDDNHKPELLCALSPFEALSGFREPRESAQLFRELSTSLVEWQSLAEVDAESRGLKAFFCRLMTLEGERRQQVVEDVIGRCRRASRDRGPFQRSFEWAVRLADAYPGDVGAVASLLLNHVRLEPLEAMFLEAGRLHAYLSGVGVEIMANSDNVLRGGLTPKHVDVSELLEVLRFQGGPVEPVQATRALPGEMKYASPAEEFALSRIDLGDGNRFETDVRGPELLLCIEGEGRVESPGHGDAPVEKRALGLPQGGACFVPYSDGNYAITGRGRFFRATVG